MAPKNRSKKGKSTGKSNGGPVTYTAEMLIEQGNVALSNMQLELAEQFYSRALTMSPSDTNIMDALADVQIQLGEPDKAVELLRQSTSLSPKENPYKWFFLGQLQLEQDAVKSYQTGIQVLTETLPTLPTEEERRVTAKHIAKAHCSIAEIYLTDLCYDDDAEGTCEREVAAAMAVFPDGLDGLQTLASLRLSQNRKREAGDLMNTVYSRVMHIRQVVSARTVVEVMSGAAEPEEFQDNPEMDFCLAAIKLLIECAAEQPTLYAKALELGSGLLEEDDENIELWYLMGVASLGNKDCRGAATTASTTAQEEEGAEGGPDFEGARYFLETARQMMDTCREEASREAREAGEQDCSQCLFAEQYELVQEHLRLIAAATNDTSGTTVATGTTGTGGGKAGKKGVALAAPVPADEEWSSGEEEESSMVVDKY